MIDLAKKLQELVEGGVIPVLHHTPLHPNLTEDPNDPEPRWCCHDQRDEMFHEHGFTSHEAVDGLLRMVRVGHRPRL